MQNLISAQEAFNAVVAGKHVLCRAAGELMDFTDLDQFPATIFAMPGYEFCIKIETIEVAGITFTKPLTLDEVKPDMDIFIIQPTGVIYHYKYGKCTAQDVAVSQGFAQRDEENAKLQIKALCSALGRTADLAQIVVPTGVHQKAKPPRKSRAKKADTVAEVNISDSAEVVAEKTSQSNIEIVAVDETTPIEDNIVSFDSVKADMKTEKSLRDRIAAAEKIEDLEVLLPELKKLHGESGHTVMTAYEQKSQKLKSTESLDIDKLKELTLAAEESIAESKRLEIEKDLLERAAVAKTPVEANKLITYTRDWTEDQRKPILAAIQKRLLELAPTKLPEAPSLMRDIQNAPDLTTLDALEIDVSTRAPDIQKTLMSEVVKRRFELENS